MTNEIAFIVNAAAGRGKGRHVWESEASQLRDANVSYGVGFTAGPGDATALAAKAIREGARTVVSVGGDGTAHEVVNGFFEEGRLLSPHARAAFIPAGTGNDVGREFPFQNGMLLSEHTAYVDLLRARFAPESGAPERYGLFHAGAGLPTEVVETSIRLKDRLGKFVYAGGSAVALYRHRPSALRFSCDGEAAIAANLSFIMVSNGRYAGGGMLMAPSASMQDGILDVITVQGASRLTMLFRLLPAVYRGAHIGHPAVGHVRARTVVIESDQPLPIQVDGELVGTTPVWIDVIPAALPVCAPVPQTLSR